jgi:hypothetical protein
MEAVESYAMVDGNSLSFLARTRSDRAFVSTSEMSLTVVLPSSTEMRGKGAREIKIEEQKA